MAIIDPKAAMAFIAAGQAIRDKCAPTRHLSLMAGTTYTARAKGHSAGVLISRPKNRKARRKAESLARAAAAERGCSRT
jgi:poly(3-hydroxybutyrate) depolymerase